MYASHRGVVGGIGQVSVGVERLLHAKAIILQHVPAFGGLWQQAA